jgi:hypothetical protein
VQFDHVLSKIVLLGLLAGTERNKYLEREHVNHIQRGSRLMFPRRPKFEDDKFQDVSRLVSAVPRHDLTWLLLLLRAMHSFFAYQIAARRDELTGSMANVIVINYIPRRSRRDQKREIEAT